MKKRYYYFLLLCLYAIIFFDILFIGKMIDTLTIGILIAIFLVARQIKELGKIFFVSAIQFLLLALLLYFAPITNTLFDIAANWTYAFLAAGVLKMLIEELQHETHK